MNVQRGWHISCLWEDSSNNKIKSQQWEQHPCEVPSCFVLMGKGTREAHKPTKACGVTPNGTLGIRGRAGGGWHHHLGTMSKMRDASCTQNNKLPTINPICSLCTTSSQGSTSGPSAPCRRYRNRFRAMKRGRDEPARTLGAQNLQAWVGACVLLQAQRAGTL